jgi:galactokinase
MIDDVVHSFMDRFGRAPEAIARAPGRANLIGEHTDYNEGFVLPMAIDRSIRIAFRRRTDGRVLVCSREMGEQAEFELDHLDPRVEGWGRYLQGAAWAFRQGGYRSFGWEGVLGGNIPIGAGLSSSAAVEIAAMRTFAFLADVPWDVQTMAGLAQKAENDWVGVRCGIMDQLASAGGKEGMALLIDCRSLEIQFRPLPMWTTVAILDTGTRRGLRDSGYNERREECRLAAQRLGVRALRDVSRESLLAASSRLDQVLIRRVRHVVTENERTLEAVQAMRMGDLQWLGRLIDESHASLRDDFEVSCTELNAMVECARAHPSCHGARMTGAGFGGCAIALVDESQAEDFVHHVSREYLRRTKTSPSIYLCKPAKGAEIILLS